MFTSLDGNSSAFGAGIISAFNGGEFDAATFGLLAALPDAAAFQSATENLLPDVTNSASFQVYETVNNVGRTVNRRILNTLDERQTADGGTGTEVGFANVDSGLWADASYRFADQSNTSSFGASTEYDADSFSFSLGYDREFDGNTLLGVSGTYSNVSIDLAREAADDVDVDVFHLAVYGAKRIQQFSLSGQIGYSFGDVSAERTAISGPVTSDYDVDGFNAQFEASYDFLLRKDGYFAPLIGLRYSGISAEEYTETGGLGLTVDTADTNIVEFRAGAISGREFEFGDNGVLDTYARVAYVNTIGSNGSDLRANFGSQSVLLEGVDGSNDRVELSGGADFFSSGRFSIGASIDSELANSYTSIGGSIRLKALF
ncbi:MAG: autotransporter outer membrane beta-barrel domain-containing protein [Hyphomonadaceae bacterium]